MSSSKSLVLKWGIVSAGLISQDFCIALQTLNKSEHHVLQACAARRLDDAQKLAERFQIASFYDSYERLFHDKHVNIVYIGSINPTHKELCLKAIRAGKHVLCEKPMTMNAKEQEEVLSAAKQKNVFFMEGLWTRFFPVIDKIKEELERKTIGELKFFQSNFLVPIENVARVNSKELGGGAILDIGIYPIQLACYFFDHEKPLKVTCSGHLMPSGVDESCSITLLFSRNRMAVLNISASASMFAETNLIGDKGVIKIPEFSWCPTRYILNGKEEHEIRLPEPKKATNFFNSVGFVYEAEAVREALCKGLAEHHKAKHEHSRLIMQIMDEAYKQLGIVN